MSGTLVLKIDAAERRIAELEHALRVYREGHPAAAARVSAQLDEAWADLARLERAGKQPETITEPLDPSAERALALLIEHCLIYLRSRAHGDTAAAEELKIS